MFTKFLCWLTSCYSCGYGGGREDIGVDKDLLDHQCPGCKRTWTTRWR